jgi:undecaprenyl-diphosphatase
VGLSAVNGWFHGLTGVHMTLYTVTDWLGLVPVAVVMAFAMLGLIQWFKRKQLFLVVRSILILGGFYVIVMGAYVLFEELVINYRPVLIGGYLESSYPSSTTLLVLCVMPTAMLQLCSRIRIKWLRAAVLAAIAAFMVFMVIGRAVSGVHWLSDIIGGGLLSAGLVLLYRHTVQHFE